MATQAEKNFEKLHTSGRLTENTAQKNAALLREFVTKQNSLIAPGGMLDDDNEYCLRAHNANNQLHRLADKYITASKVCEMTSSKAVDKNTNFDIISAVINNLPEKQKDGTWQSGDKGRLYDTVFKNQEFTKKDKADAKNLIMKTPHKTFAPVYKKIQHVWQDGKTDNITIDINAPIGR